MEALSSNKFITRRAWFREIVGGQDVILRSRSALEFLNLFSGYSNEKEVEVFARVHGANENINYHIVEDFSRIECVRIGEVLCSSVTQAINDMLEDLNNTDEQALAEALSDYYYSNNESFDGLLISQKNMANFERMREWAIDYYNEG